MNILVKCSIEGCENEIIVKMEDCESPIDKKPIKHNKICFHFHKNSQILKTIKRDNNV